MNSKDLRDALREAEDLSDDMGVVAIRLDVMILGKLPEVEILQEIEYVKYTLNGAKARIDKLLGMVK